MDPRSRLGQKGERIAVRSLKRRGYRLRDTNYRAPSGEIDLVAEDGDTVVFIEVKTRTSQEFGGPLESITPRKQHRIVQAARHYLTRHRLAGRPVRFDVVGIELTSRRPRITVVQGAFDAGD